MKKIIILISLLMLNSCVALGIIEPIETSNDAFAILEKESIKKQDARAGVYSSGKCYTAVGIIIERGTIQDIKKLMNYSNSKNDYLRMDIVSAVSSDISMYNAASNINYVPVYGRLLREIKKFELDAAYEEQDKRPVQNLLKAYYDIGYAYRNDSVPRISMIAKEIGLAVKKI